MPERHREVYKKAFLRIQMPFCKKNVCCDGYLGSGTIREKEIISKLNEIMTDYFHYYGITDNSERITAFRYNVMKSLFYWLNRRSQKKSYNWVEFLNMIDNSYPLVRARIYVSVYD